MDLIYTELKTLPKTATMGGNMLLSKRLKGALSGGEITAYADLGGQALLGAELVGVSC